jgi:hypothetical protein
LDLRSEWREADARSGGREEEELRVYIRAGPGRDEDAAAVLVLVPLQLHLEASAITDGRTEIGGRQAGKSVAVLAGGWAC